MIPFFQWCHSTFRGLKEVDESELVLIYARARSFGGNPTLMGIRYNKLTGEIFTHSSINEKNHTFIPTDERPNTSRADAVYRIVFANVFTDSGLFWDKE